MYCADLKPSLGLYSERHKYHLDYQASVAAAVAALEILAPSRYWPLPRDHLNDVMAITPP
jgi:hypothetical protein